MIDEIIFRSNDGTSLGFHFYQFDTLREIEQQALLKMLYEKIKMNHGELLCGCNEQLLDISLIDGHYFLTCIPGTRKFHDKKCMFSNSKIGKSYLEKGWKNDFKLGSNTIDLCLDNFYFSKKKHEHFKQINAPYLISNNDKMTFKGLNMLINTMMWNSFIKEKERFPATLKELYASNSEVLSKIKLEKPSDKTLNHFISSEKVTSLNKPLKSKWFLSGILKSFELVKSKENYLMDDVQVKMIDLFSNDEYILTIDGRDFRLSLLQTGLSTLKNRKWMISLIIIVQKDHLQVESVSLLPISKKGLSYLNDHERLLYNYLSNNNKPFTKPVRQFFAYNETIPAAIVKEDQTLELFFFNDDIDRICDDDSLQELKQFIHFNYFDVVKGDLCN